MKYILYHDAKWGKRTDELTQSKNMSEAIKEALIVKICDFWNFSFDDSKQPIDFNNFDVWLINWLKTTRYWDISAINSNVENDSHGLYYETLKDNVLENLKLYRYKNDDIIYEISDEKDIVEDLRNIKISIVGEAVLKEIEQIQASREKREYERLKKKFEAIV